MNNHLNTQNPPITTITYNTPDIPAHSSQSFTNQELLLAALIGVVVVKTLSKLVYDQLFPSNTSQLLAQRRLTVGKNISKVDHFFTQLYFLAHQVDHSTLKSSPEQAPLPPPSTLAGSYFDHNIASLVQSFKEFQSTLPEHDGALISGIIHSLNEAFELALRISCIDEAAKATSRAAIQQDLIENLWTKYQQLQAGERMLIPAGYLNGDRYDLSRSTAGHGVLIEIKKREHDQLEIRVFNTGEGTDFHDSTEHMVYPLAFTGIQSSLIKRNLFEFLTAGAHSNSQTVNKIADLYHLLTWTSGPNRETYHHPNDAKYYTQGNANSCAHQCLLAWVKYALTEKPALYHHYMSYLVNDRITKARKRLGKQPSALYLTQPYVAYSFKRQPSVPLTILSAVRRALTGPAVYKRVASKNVASVLNFFPQNWRHEPDTEKESSTLIHKRSSLSDLKDYRHFIRRLPYSIIYPPYEQLNKEEKDLFFSFSDNLRDRVFTEKTTLDEALALQREIEALAKDFPEIKQWPYAQFIEDRHLTPTRARELTEDQYNRLKVHGVPEAILSRSGSLEECLTLQPHEFSLIERFIGLVKSNQISISTCRSLNEDQIKRLDRFEGWTSKSDLNSNRSLLSVEKLLSLTDEQCSKINKFFIQHILRANDKRGIDDFLLLTEEEIEHFNRPENVTKWRLAEVTDIPMSKLRELSEQQAQETWDNYWNGLGKT